MKNCLIIRFSSFGDVVQAMNAARELKLSNPSMKITWITKKAFRDFVIADSSIDNVLTLEDDFNGSVLNIKAFIVQESFDLIYDAHNNLRTLILKLSLMFINKSYRWIERPKSRLKRFLLFRFRINLFPKPFLSKISYLSPLKKYINEQRTETFSKIDFSTIDLEKFEDLHDSFFVFAPSAAWEMKRWPTNYWKEVINHFSKKIQIVLVGGPDDKFIADLIEQKNHSNILNLAGKLSFFETFYLVSKAKYTLSADTGVIHVADLIGANGGLILGPTAFGRTSSSCITIFENDMACRPCSKDGRGSCSQKIYQECMVKIVPSQIIKQISTYC